MKIKDANHQKIAPTAANILFWLVVIARNAAIQRAKKDMANGGTMTIYVKCERS